MQVTPQISNQAGIIGAAAQPQTTTLLVNPVTAPVSTKVELTKPNQHQISVAVVPQAPQSVFPAANLGLQSPTVPQVVSVYNPPGAVAAGTLPVLQGQNPPPSVGYLMPPQSPGLPYVAPPNLGAVPPAIANPAVAGVQSPSAALISPSSLLPSLVPGAAAVPSVGRAPPVVMLPGLRPPAPQTGPRFLDLTGGVRRLKIPSRQNGSYQRHVNYQPGYTRHYGDENRDDAQKQSYQGYQNSPYSNQGQWNTNSYYPASSYQRTRGTASVNTYQRRYRRMEGRIHNQGKTGILKSDKVIKK